MSLTVVRKLLLSIEYTKALDLSTPADLLEIEAVRRYQDGDASGESDLVWHDRRTLSASATEDLDLAGGLTDSFGDTVTFDVVKGIYVYAAAGNTNNVVLGAASSNAFVGPWGAAGTHSVPPGGIAYAEAYGAGWDVTAATADLLKVANSGGTTGVTYDIVIFGVAA